MKQFINRKISFRYTKLTLKTIVSKENFRIFSIKYIAKTEEYPLRIYLTYAYRTINRGLYVKKFIKLEDKPKIEETIHVIRNKINKIEGADNMFATYSKIKKAVKRAKTKTNNHKLFRRCGYLF